jgi:hypothetical protein
MRPPVDEARIRALAVELGRVARSPVRLYLAGGSTAVLEGWREATIPGWRERSPHVFSEGRVDVHHFDPYSQALSKIERGFAQDLADVRTMISRGLVEPRRLRHFYETIEPELYRYPAIDPTAFRHKVDSELG